MNYITLYFNTLLLGCKVLILYI